MRVLFIKDWKTWKAGNKALMRDFKARELLMQGIVKQIGAQQDEEE